uniref:Uncharacterized protein n=1 Tax=Panagrolaimus sp. JU765 TaxID=591449 RepID=A0AC34QD97_9BILA
TPFTKHLDLLSLNLTNSTYMNSHICEKPSISPGHGHILYHVSCHI